MQPPGHLATAYLLTRHRTGFTGQFQQSGGLILCALAGSLFPDFVDKPMWLLDWTPFSRTVGHSVFALAAVVAAWAVYSRLSRHGAGAFGWFVLGYASHLVVDLVDELVAGFLYIGYAFSPWFLWPLVEADAWYWRIESVLFACKRCYTPLELAVVAVALYFARRR